MKFRFSHIVIILIGFVAGYLLSPTFFPVEEVKIAHEEEQPVEPPTPDKTEPDKPVVDDTPKVVQDDTPKEDDTPIADEGEDDVDFNDSEDEADEDDLDTTNIRKMRRIAVEGEDRRPVKEEKFSGKISDNNWRHPKSLYRQLAMKIRRAVYGLKPEQAIQAIQKPETRLILAQWELLNRADLDALTKLMSDRKAAASLTPLLNDLPWVSSFVYDGEMTKPEVALGMVYHFRLADPNMDREVLLDDPTAPTGVKRRIASAVAVEYTRNNWYGEGRELSKEELEILKENGMPINTLYDKSKRKEAARKDVYRSARERYLYFAQSWDQRKLNSKFAKTPDWLMHFICGWKSDMNNPFGSASSLRWQRDNASAPAGKYTGMCSQVPYLPLNVFGDVIFSNWYYEPFDAAEPGLHSKVVRDVGGVCGSLSHFGASSAIANGVPAFTMGEPGHCAYAVYTKGKWNRGNSLFPKHSPHWSFWGHSTWSAMNMYTEMYESGQRTRDAQMICTIGNMYSANKSPNNALKYYEVSVMMQPLNQTVWENYLKTAAKSLSRKPAKYLGVNEFICTNIAPKYPEMCAYYLTDVVYPTLLKTLRTPKQKLVAFDSYFNHLKTNEEAEWDMEKMLDQQYESLGKLPSVKEHYFQTIVESVQKHPDFGQAASWALCKAFMDNDRIGKKTRTMVDKALAATPKDEDHDKARRLLNAAVIRAAETMCKHAMSPNVRISNRDKDYYMSLVNEYSKDYLEPEEGSKPMPAFIAPEGNLISEGGVVMLEKYHEDLESIVKHAAALTPKGGLIRSQAGRHVKMTLELPKKSNIGAIVIVPSGGSCGSYREWFIETSADGKNWELFQNLPDSSDKPCLVVEVKHAPKAKYIRIDSGGEQMVGINFKAVLVYDNKKAK